LPALSPVEGAVHAVFKKQTISIEVENKKSRIKKERILKIKQEHGRKK
jgi:hypothetical protein